jgi:hypothetical protein
MRNKFVPILATALVAFGLVMVPAVTAEAATTGKITIQVVNPANKKLMLKNAAVTLTSGAKVLHGVTNKVGKVTFRVPAGAKQRISMTKTGYLPFTSKLIKGKAHKVLSLRVPITKGATIAGTVTGEGGTKLSNSIVSVFTTAGTFVTSATTNSVGAYTVSGLKSGKYHVQFNSRSFYDATNTAITGFSSTYWPTAATWANSTAITVKNQGKKTKASVVKAISAVVPVGHSIIGGISIVDVASEGWAGLVGANDSLNTAGPLNGLGTGFNFKVPAGKYKLWVTNGLTGDLARTYWYTGSLLPSLNPADAAEIDFDGTADTHISLISLTPQTPPTDLPPVTVPPITVLPTGNDPLIVITVPPIVLPLPIPPIVIGPIKIL